MTQSFESQIPPFEDFLRGKGTETLYVPNYIIEKVSFLKTLTIDPATGLTWWNWLKREIDRASQISDVLRHPELTLGHPSYPDQGAVRTGYENDMKTIPTVVSLDGEDRFQRPQPEITVMRYEDSYVEFILYAWIYYLELFNHPERVSELFVQSDEEFQAPQKKKSKIFDAAKAAQESITIRDLALTVQGSEEKRLSRTDRFKAGPFVNYGTDNRGRMQARSFITSGANPDVFGSAMALSTMAQAHSLANVPRDGFFSDTDRQADLAKKVFEWNKNSPVLIGRPEAEQQKLLEFFNYNVVGVLEADKRKAVNRARLLYEAGVRSFRVYSPEPGNGPVETTKALRAWERVNKLEPIEIFAGQIVSVQQAKDAEAAGANALYLGIGGGGRCITGIVGNLTIDWPQLLWDLRGEVKIPVFVEGGASDAIGVTFVVGASGIGATGKLGGNIENPGGYLTFMDPDGQIFVYYGGEASDRMRVMGGRVGPFDRIENTEGETRRIYIEQNAGQIPTMMQMLLSLHQAAIGVEIFQNLMDIRELQDKGVDSLRIESFNGAYMKNTH